MVGVQVQDGDGRFVVLLEKETDNVVPEEAAAPDYQDARERGCQSRYRRW